MLRTIAESLQSDREELVKMIKETLATCREEDINKRKKRLILAQRRKEELEKLLCKIYEDHILEKIPDARYVMLDEQYAKEQAVLSNEIKEIEGTIQQYEKDQKSADQFITLIDKYKNFNVLTNTMLNEFVEKFLSMNVLVKEVRTLLKKWKFISILLGGMYHPILEK